MTKVGQRLYATNPRYIAHPTTLYAPTAGYPMDAGTAMQITNNIDYLCFVNTRNLFASVGNSSPWSANNNNATFNGYVDLPYTPTNQVVEPIQDQIPWTRQCSERWGPFFIPCDKELSNGYQTIRNIVVDFGYHSSTTSQTDFYVATTPTSLSPHHGYLSIAKHSVSAIGSGSIRSVMSSSNALNENYLISSSPSGEQTSVMQVYVWFGFKLATGDCDWLWIDGWEAR